MSTGRVAPPSYHTPPRHARSGSETHISVPRCRLGTSQMRAVQISGLYDAGYRMKWTVCMRMSYSTADCVRVLTHFHWMTACTAGTPKIFSERALRKKQAAKVAMTVSCGLKPQAHQRAQSVTAVVSCEHLRKVPCICAGLAFDVHSHFKACPILHSNLSIGMNMLFH